jgi:hypothetical protein
MGGFFASGQPAERGARGNLCPEGKTPGRPYSSVAWSRSRGQRNSAYGGTLASAPVNDPVKSPVRGPVLTPASAPLPSQVEWSVECRVECFFRCHFR